MPRPSGRTRPCSPATISGRLSKANQFLDAAELIEDLVDDGELADAFVTLCVHAGIAASDVICCRRLGEHADGQNHVEAVALLARVDKAPVRDLDTLLGMKTRSGYSEMPSTSNDVKRSLRAARRLVDAAKQATAS